MSLISRNEMGVAPAVKTDFFIGGGVGGGEGESDGGGVAVRGGVGVRGGTIVASHRFN